LLRGASALCVALRWGVRSEALPGSELYGAALASTLDRVMGDYEREFPHLSPPAHPEPLDDATSAENLARLRAIVAEVDPALVDDDGPAPPGLDAFLARISGFLDVFSAAYRYPAPPLLPAPGVRSAAATASGSTAPARAIRQDPSPS
jgi:hypothetical protein